jgi:predicted DNA-binding protein (MmcQ/YjbR family)
MLTADTFCRIALSLPETVEDAHFENRSFKVSKKIFATLNEKENRATVKLSPSDQDLFCLADSTMVYPVPNKWGKLGWTHINLQTVKPEMCTELLKVAYCQVAPKKYTALISFEE